MLIFFLYFYFLPSSVVGFPEQIPYSIFSSLKLPLFIHDTIFDFSPNIKYSGLLYKTFDPDSEKTMVRTLLYRANLGTEENSFRILLPILNKNLSTVFDFKLFKTKAFTPDFVHHRYNLKITSTSLPLHINYLQIDANPDSNEIINLKKYSLSFTPFSFNFKYEIEESKVNKQKFLFNFANKFQEFYYSFGFQNYIFYLQKKRKLKNFIIHFIFPFKLFTYIEQGMDSKDGERYKIKAGFLTSKIRLYFFMEKLIFPLCYEYMRDSLKYEPPIRTRGINLSFNIKYFKNNIFIKTNYRKVLNFLTFLPLKDSIFLYSGNLLSFYISDTIYILKNIELFIKYRQEIFENFNIRLFTGGINLYLITNPGKNYFIWVKGELKGFSDSYLLNLSINGNFYSYLFLSFNYTHPIRENFFYPEEHSPFPFYSVHLKANIVN